MRVLIVSGTDTGVGKTVVTAALAALAHARGERVAVVKAAQAGEPRDVDAVRRLTGIADVHELACYAEPLAPATAARRAARCEASIGEMAAAVRALDDRDLVLVEGSGGLLVRLDGDGGTIADLAAELDAPVLVVARAGLGTLNHSALTCEALRARNVECAGIVVGSYPADADLASRCNLEDLPAYARAPLVGRLPEGAGDYDRVRFLAAARRGMEVEVPA